MAHLPPHAILVFAVTYESGRGTGPEVVLRIDHAARRPCCDGTYVAGGEYVMAGAGPREAYSMIVHVYFGSPPTHASRSEAQRALDRLVLPRPG